MLSRLGITATDDWSRSTLSDFKPYEFQAKFKDKDIICVLNYSCSSTSKHCENPKSFIDNTISDVLLTATDLNSIKWKIIERLNQAAILVERNSLGYRPLSPSKVFGS